MLCVDALYIGVSIAFIFIAVHLWHHEESNYYCDLLCY